MLDRVSAGKHLLLAAVTLVLAAGPAAARADAAETVIGFDDQANGTVIDNQYEGQGVTFDVAPTGAAGLHPKVVEPPAGEPHSSPKALDVSQKCGSEFPEAHMWARFAAARDYVAIYVGNVEPTEGHPADITLQGYDLGGNAIPAAKETKKITGIGIDTILEVSDAESNISYIQLTSPASTFCHVAVDDLTFETVPSTIPPDFGLSGPSLTTTITPGGSASVPLVLHRNPTSVGPINFVVSGLPPGVMASVSPNPSSGGDGSGLTLSLSAVAGAPPVFNGFVTVEGVPSAEAGEHNRSVKIPFSVAGNYDLRAQGLEVTQGIQPEGGLKPSGSNESGGTYNWLSLIAHKKTAVRFFADAHGQIASGIKEVGTLLYGFRDGRELPGSPLRPDYGPPSTRSGGPGLTSVQEDNPAPVLEAERTSNEHAYTFTLPESWTSGTISLRGHIFQEPGFPQPGRRPECSTTECTANNDFTINGVKFYETKTVALDTLELTANGESPVSAAAATEDARLIAPLAEPGWNLHNPNDGFTVLPYQGVIDISDIVNSSKNGTEKGDDAHGRVKDWASAMGNPNFSTMGIARSGFRGVTGGGTETAFGTFGNIAAITFDPTETKGENRPLSGVAHELFHQFGLSHASAECGGAAGGGSTAWPLKPGETHAAEAAAMGVFSGSPNSTEGFGQLLGIGLRMDAYPYRIVADGVSWPQNMDLMSYCVANAGGWMKGDPGVWVSPINWDAVYRTFAASAGAHSSRSARRGKKRPDVRVNRGRLRVIGFSSGSSFTFTTVGPQVGPPLKAGKSNFTLLARGRRGQILHRAPMAAQEIHADMTAVMLELSAEVPSHGVESVEVLDNGVAVAKRERPRRRPKVRVLAPRLGAVVGGRGNVAVRWRTVGASSKNDTASVDFSGDGGRTWRAVYIGPDRGTAKIPGTYLAGTRRARLRVRVNDGFDEAEATSDIFTSRAAPPEVTIARTPSVLPGDARLQLSGQAFQAGPTALKGKSLRWFDGSVPLGSGTAITAGPLPPGTNHIRLVAHGEGGSTATAAVKVKVTPVRLPFLQLSIPKKVPPRAKQVVVKARSAVPALLTVNKSKFKLGEKAKKLHVPIGPRGRSWLQMAVTAAGVRTAFTAIVRSSGGSGG